MGSAAPPPALPEDPLPPGIDRRTVFDQLRVQTWALFILAFAALIGLLVAGRFILMSLVLAVIVFSLTLGIIRRVARLRLGGYGLPMWLCYSVAFLLITTALVGSAAFVVSKINGLVVEIVVYSDIATQAVARLFDWVGEGAANEILGTLRAINIASYVRVLAAQASTLVSVAVMTSMFVGFLFAEQGYFRPKLLALFPGEAEAQRASRIAASIMTRVNRYLMVKTAVSAGVALFTYATMVGFGLQFAPAIGVLTFFLNYIPNIGTLIASGLAILAALVQQPGWEVMVAFSAIVAGLQFFSGNVLEPVLMGRSLAVSTFGIVLTLTFWGAVWGVMGMFLAVPITVAMLVVFANIAPLRPWAVLLSADGDLSDVIED